MELSSFSLSLLCFTALCAGFIDAIAGGGGLLTVPALLAAGLPPHLTLGTNKGQSVFGSAAALFRFSRAGLVDGRRAAVGFPLGFLGSCTGAALVLVLEPKVLKPLVLVLLIFAGVVLAVRRSPPSALASTPPLLPRVASWTVAGIALVLGTYDGFFGPGTGTFLILAFVSLLHFDLPRATAEAKVINFSSNLAAVSLFACRGLVLWKVALPMAGAQLLGSYLGAHTAVRGGARIIRWAVLLVVAALVLKLGFDLLGARAGWGGSNRWGADARGGKSASRSAPESSYLRTVLLRLHAPTEHRWPHHEPMWTQRTRTYL